MRGENKEGRFDIRYERNSFVPGTTTELGRTVGNNVEWWFYDGANTVVDPIYDVGGSTNQGGRRWRGPVIIPTVRAQLIQGVTSQNDRGFYNVDTLTITINVDVAEKHLSLLGANASTSPQLGIIELNPDDYLRDRVVYRSEVFTVNRVLPVGIIKEKFTLLSIECKQVNPEELDNDPQFQSYAQYSAFDPSTLPQEPNQDKNAF